jgi:hypothetical protein
LRPNWPDPTGQYPTGETQTSVPPCLCMSMSMRLIEQIATEQMSIHVSSHCVTLSSQRPDWPNYHIFPPCCHSHATQWRVNYNFNILQIRFRDSINIQLFLNFTQMFKYKYDRCAIADSCIVVVLVIFCLLELAVNVHPMSSDTIKGLMKKMNCMWFICRPNCLIYYIQSGANVLHQDKT